LAKESQTQPRRERRRRRPPVGASPGVLMIDPAAPKPQIDLIAYGPEGMTETRIADPQALRQHLGKWPVLWVNVSGLGDEATLLALGEVFGLHRLALADVVNVYQRAKADAYADHMFLIARMIETTNPVQTDQTSLFLGKNFVVTFQERPGDCFGPLRERLRSGAGKVRSSGTGYLAYAILDAIVDGYFPALEEFGERLERLENEITERPSREGIGEIHDVKRDLLTLRRSIWPIREMLGSLLRETHPYFSGDDRYYFQDCYDHSVQVIDLLETFRELSSGLMEVYLSSVSNRLNEVVKVLTIFTSIFIPLSFIASVYGMNFDTSRSPWNMPELKWVYGYPFALALMVGTAVSLLYYFRRMGWIGGEESARARARGRSAKESADRLGRAAPDRPHDPAGPGAGAPPGATR
jgi:magnesium transporter